MPQTMLGLLGLMLITLIAINQQRITIRGYELRLNDEYDLAASGVMMHVMELIASRSFDERSTPGHIHSSRRVPSKATDFSPASQFGVTDRGGIGCNLERPTVTPDCDDVDDLHGIRDQLVHAHLRDGKTMPFEISIDVFYVRDGDLETPAMQRTKNKRIILTARSPLLPGVELVRLERVVSYDPLKAEADFERIYGILTTSL